MKSALVISGGGSKGAFAVGVLKELFLTYPGLDFDIYVGTSTGSLVVSLASLGKMDTLEELYTHITNDDILKKSNIGDRINDTSIFDVSPLWHLIEKTFTDADYQQLLDSGKRVMLNTVCLQTQQLNVFTNDASSVNPSDYVIQQTINANHFRRAMLASSCQPVFMQPILIGRDVPGAVHPEYQFVDGGVLEYIGIQMAIDAGAKNILAIMLSAEEDTVVQSTFTNLMEILGQTIDILVSDSGKNDMKLFEQHNAALKYIAAAKSKMKDTGISDQQIEEYFQIPGSDLFQDKAPVNIIKIRPNKPLGGGPGGLNFNPAEMQGMLATGQLVFNDVAAHVNFDSFIV